MHRLLRSGFILVLLAGGAMALASDNLPQTAVAPELSRMDIWVGRWQSKTQVMTTPFSQAASTSSEMTCSWSPNHGFLLCDHLMHAADGSTTNSLSVYTYDEQAKVYKFFGVEKDSSPREVPMEVNGNVWSFGTEVQNDDKTIMFLTSDDFVSATEMHFQTQFSEDNGRHWEKMNQGNLKKIG